MIGAKTASHIPIPNYSHTLAPLNWRVVMHDETIFLTAVFADIFWFYWRVGPDMTATNLASL